MSSILAPKASLLRRFRTVALVAIVAALVAVFAVAAAVDQAQAASFKKAKASGGVSLTYVGDSSEVEVPAKYEGRKVVGFTASSKGLVSANLTSARYLKTLVIKDNKLKKLNVSKNTRLEKLDVSDNRLEALTVSKNKRLKVLRCGANKLKKLSVSENRKLVELDCCENALAKLGVAKLAKLKILCVAGNKLAKFDVRKNKNLVELDVRDNAKLTSLRISNSIPKTTLMVSGCKKLDAATNARLDNWSARSSRETDFVPSLSR